MLKQGSDLQLPFQNTDRLAFDALHEHAPIGDMLLLVSFGAFGPVL